MSTPDEPEPDRADATASPSQQLDRAAGASEATETETSEQSPQALPEPSAEQTAEEPGEIVAGPTEVARADGFPIVALGSSAGGLQALEEFFSKMPADSGSAFVIITHQALRHTTMLHALIGRKTTMPTSEVTKGTKVEPNHVYVGPPGRNLAILHGVLQPMEADVRAAVPLPIDFFFRSLADDQRERAIGIVLSGTGSDGTLGIKELKANLGMVMAQHEESAAYAGMPHSAIATGLVDFVLPPSDMPQQILGYVRGLPGRFRPVREHGPVPDALQQIFVLLRSRTGHDFSLYKISTIHRRIERRLVLHHLDSLRHYVRMLQENPVELDVLFKELLIGVTSFFRDPEAFDTLAQALETLLAAKPLDHTVRVWVAGCSTGEEAYSIAILLRECMDHLMRPLQTQIFATDIDAAAIDVARAGLYPLNVAADIPRARLDRFFIGEDQSYRVKKEIRDMVVFATQNLIADPPFTKLDLLLCRNLLIYLDAPLQRRLIPLFHYSLRKDGILFLGSSESIGGFSDLFGSLDRKWKIYRRKDALETTGAEFPAAAPPPSPLVPPVVHAPRATTGLVAGDRVILRELAPPAAIVRERGDIVHIHGRTGLFLEPTPGPPTANIFTMAREGLGSLLAGAVRQAAGRDGDVVHRDVRVVTNGSAVLVDLRVRRLLEPEPYSGMFLVAFERVRPFLVEAATDRDDLAGKPRDRVVELERELQLTKETQQSTVEELEAANEELKSTNEELQSTNEELQSANEELETSKEEMQSLNEEMQTVNGELEGKVEELSRLNDDMKNLLNSTDIATIFLDGSLNIKRYTEQATRVFRLIPSDIGRSIGDIVSRLRYHRLGEDARDVLRTLVFKEIEVRGVDDDWFLMRIVPYRTTENFIDGVVITFVDITKIKGLEKIQRRLLDTLRSSPTSVFGQDQGLRYQWSGSWAFGRPAEQVVGKTDHELFRPEEARLLVTIKRQVLDSKIGTRQVVQLTLDGSSRTYDLFVEPMRDESGDVIGVAGVATDVTTAVKE